MFGYRLAHSPSTYTTWRTAAQACRRRLMHLVIIIFSERIWHVDHVFTGVWFSSFVQFEDSYRVLIYVFSTVNSIQPNFNFFNYLTHL
jgi:hypothetical protein